MCNLSSLIVWNELLSLLKPGTLIIGEIKKKLSCDSLTDVMDL